MAVQLPNNFSEPGEFTALVYLYPGLPNPYQLTLSFVGGGQKSLSYSHFPTQDDVDYLWDEWADEQVDEDESEDEEDVDVMPLTPYLRTERVALVPHVRTTDRIPLTPHVGTATDRIPLTPYVAPEPVRVPLIPFNRAEPVLGRVDLTPYIRPPVQAAAPAAAPAQDGRVPLVAHVRGNTPVGVTPAIAACGNAQVDKAAGLRTIRRLLSEVVDILERVL